jgi:hypothetical protein
MKKLKKSVYVTQKEVQLFIGCTTEESAKEYIEICKGLEKKKITMNDCFHYWSIMLEKDSENIEKRQNTLNLLRKSLTGSVFVTPLELELVFWNLKESIQGLYEDACKAFEKEQITILDWMAFVDIGAKYLEDFVESLNQVRLTTK